MSLSKLALAEFSPAANFTTRSGNPNCRRKKNCAGASRSSTKRWLLSKLGRRGRTEELENGKLIMENDGAATGIENG
jgi:hypothetical protein